MLFVCRGLQLKAYLRSLRWAEQRELLWSVAEARSGEQRSSDRHLSFLRFTSSRCLHIQPTQPAVSGGRECVYVYLCLCVCVYICPGPRYAALIKPTAKRKNTPGCQFQWPWIHIWLFWGKQMGGKWNTQAQLVQRRKRGGTLSSSSQPDYSTESWKEKEFIDFQPFFLLAVMYIWVLVCDNTCQPFQSCCKQGCLVPSCHRRGQSGSLVLQTIHQNHVPEAGTEVCGPGACSDKVQSDAEKSMLLEVSSFDWCHKELTLQKNFPEAMHTHFNVCWK